MLDTNNSHHHSIFEVEINSMRRPIYTLDSKLFLEMKSSIPINPNKLFSIQRLRQHSFLTSHDPIISLLSLHRGFNLNLYLPTSFEAHFVKPHPDLSASGHLNNIVKLIVSLLSPNQTQLFTLRQRLFCFVTVTIKWQYFKYKVNWDGIQEVLEERDVQSEIRVFIGKSEVLVPKEGVRGWRYQVRSV